MRLELDTVEQRLRLDGIDMALEVLWGIVNPNPRIFYRFERQGDQVLAHTYWLVLLGLGEEKDA